MTQYDAWEDDAPRHTAEVIEAHSYVMAAQEWARRFDEHTHGSMSRDDNEVMVHVALHGGGKVLRFRMTAKIVVEYWAEDV